VKGVHHNISRNCIVSKVPALGVSNGLVYRGPNALRRFPRRSSKPPSSSAIENAWHARERFGQRHEVVLFPVRVDRVSRSVPGSKTRNNSVAAVGGALYGTSRSDLLGASSSSDTPYTSTASEKERVIPRRGMANLLASRPPNPPPKALADSPFAGPASPSAVRSRSRRCRGKPLCRRFVDNCAVCFYHSRVNPAGAKLWAF
jgi:hypothetical protein